MHLQQQQEATSHGSAQSFALPEGQPIGNTVDMKLVGLGKVHGLSHEFGEGAILLGIQTSKIDE